MDKKNLGVFLMCSFLITGILWLFITTIINILLLLTNNNDFIIYLKGFFDLILRLLFIFSFPSTLIGIIIYIKGNMEIKRDSKNDKEPL